MLNARDAANESGLRLCIRNVTDPQRNKAVAPDDVALQVIQTIDPYEETKRKFPMLYFAALGMIKQLIREEQRSRRQRKDGDELNSPLLPGFELLQPKYPRAHNGHGKPTYVPRDEITERDWLWNLGQFDRDIEGREAHRDQFRRWGLARGFREQAARAQS